MALPNQLKAARMSDATDRSTIDNHVGALETAICDILGITIDSDVSAAILAAVDTSGRITGRPRMYGAGNAAGWRFRDSGTGDEFLLAQAAGYMVVYENTGTEGTPIWTKRWSLELSTGLTKQEILPICRVTLAADMSIPTSTDTEIEWTSENYDPDGWHDNGSNPERITVPEAGMYICSAQVRMDPAAGGGQWAVTLRGNGSDFASVGFVNLDTTNIMGINVTGVMNMDATDYFEVRTWQNSGGAINCDVNSQCQVARISG